MRTDCHDIRQALGPLLSRELAPGDTSRVELHLESCADCRKLRSRLARLDGLLVAAPVPGLSRDEVQLMALRARESSRRSRMVARFATAAAVVATVLIPLGTYLTLQPRTVPPRVIASDPFGTADLDF
jgi:predicted anti-sigma-YlaC factor YlaD